MTDTATSQSIGAPEPETLEEAIARTRQERETALADKEASDSAFADADGRLDALLQLQSDIDQAKEGYEAAHDQLKIEQQALEDYDESERECLEELLGDLTAEVDQQHADYERELTDAEGAVTTAESHLTQAEADHDSKGEARDGKATDVAELQQLAATIRGRHGQLGSIRDEVNRAHRDGYYALAYWLLKHGDFRDLLADHPELIDPDDLPADLLAAVNELGDAEQAFAESDAALTKRQDERAEAKAHLADRKAKAEGELRDRLKQIVPTEA